MNRRWAVLAAIVAIGATLSAVNAGTREDTPPPEMSALARYDEGLQHLDRALLALDSGLRTGDTTAARDAFRRARAAYKRVELFVEYYRSGEVRELNGVPMARAEDEDPETPLPPVGLQMVEMALYPGEVPDTVRAARRYIGYMRSTVAQLRRAGADSMPGDDYLFDAMRQEIARVSTLGIAGFDATASGDAIVESAEALQGVSDALAPYRARAADTVPFAALDSAFARAIAFLRSARTAERIDRVAFLSRHALPLAHRLADVQHALGIGVPAKPRAWSSHSASVYDRDAFDRGFFAATDAPPTTPNLVELGKALFFETALSGSGQRSCASCHLPSRAFTDGRARAGFITEARGRGRLSRNTPTLLNAALQPTLFADGRVRTLEDQATDVIGNPREMGGSLERAAAVLRTRPEYVRRFSRTFPGDDSASLSGRTLRLALAAYVRSLVALDSRFDRAVRGDSSAMTTEERSGFDLFMGRAACGTCHFAPLFHGATPPMFVESEPEVIGVPATPRSHRATIDSDSGRFNVRRIDQHLHAFRTPTLRNVELTAPYMHNGVYRTLEEVIDFYDVGGGHGIGASLPHQTLPPDSLHLTRAEKRSLAAFLRTLTDTVAH